MSDDLPEGTERSGGTTIKVGSMPAVVGSGYRGKREDQDEAVKEFARRLSKEFPHDIVIRYNTNRLGGGAWLKDGQGNSQVGLGADLNPPREHRRQSNKYVYGDGEKPPSVDTMDPEELVLKYTVNLKVPAVPDYRADNRMEYSDSKPYAYKSFDNLERAWKWFINSVVREEVNDPA